MLKALPIPVANPLAATPSRVARFLADAEQRSATVLDEARFPAFVPCDHHRVWPLLGALLDQFHGTAPRFCEWGSGLGIVAGLAALAGWEAYGIEIEPELVAEARTLAARYALPVRFAVGSFLPTDVARTWVADPEATWLSTQGPSGYAELGLDLQDFNLIFVFPWPVDVEPLKRLFAARARRGAQLLIHHHGGVLSRWRRD
jgi:hypothetical protein